MGCCGCSNQSSAITAGIFGLIQSLVWLILNGFFLELYFNFSSALSLDRVNTEGLFLLYATRNQAFVIQIVLVIATLLHSSWFISSVILLIGNSTKNSCCCRQWVIITSFIIIGDILLPIIIIASTLGSFGDVVRSVGAAALPENESDRFGNRFETRLVNTAGAVGVDLYKYYILLLVTFCKGGLITIIINICLNVFTNRRASEINNPQGYIIMSNPVAIVQGHPVPYPVQHQQVHFFHPGSNPQGFSNPQYVANIPLQPTAQFAPTPGAGSEHLDNRFEEPIQPLFEK